MAIIAATVLYVNMDITPAHAVNNGKITFCTNAKGAFTCFDTNPHCKVYQKDFSGTKCRENSQ